MDGKTTSLHFMPGAERLQIRVDVWRARIWTRKYDEIVQRHIAGRQKQHDGQHRDGERGKRFEVQAEHLSGIPDNDNARA